MSVSWNTVLRIAGQSLLISGVAGAATKYLTKSTLQLYNKICPATYKIKNKNAEKISDFTAAVISSATGISLFACKLSRKYRKSDEMPAEILQEYKDKQFLDKIARLLPHLMPHYKN